MNPKSPEEKIIKITLSGTITRWYSTKYKFKKAKAFRKKRKTKQRAIAHRTA